MCPNLNVKDCINYRLFGSGTYPPGPSTTSKKSDTGFFPGSLLLKCVLDDLFPSNRCTFFYNLSATSHLSWQNKHSRISSAE